MSQSIPLVTGISPKEGPPGTRVTIRGENLGKTHTDFLGLTICGVDCYLTADWVSPNKIHARTLMCKGRGDIVVTTRSGGIGSSSVQFRGFLEIIAPSKESAVWVDETVSVGPRPLSMATYQQEDPLQISTEGNDKKYPAEELLELFAERSGNLRSENFSAAWFLLEHHHSTSFEDLKSGLHFLSRRVGSQTEGKLSFLKENISSVMDQLDALLLVKEKQDRFAKRHGDGFITRIDESIGVCEREAGKLFQDVLARKERADLTRNALSGFHRFKFLFSLPGTLEKSIQRGEFETAINDYARARSLFNQPETEKPVFTKFRAATEHRVQKLRERLRSKLLEKPPQVQEQRIIISHLVTLECDYDPAWECLKCHHEFICNSLKKCFQQFSSDGYQAAGTVAGRKNKQDVSASPSEIQFVSALCDLFLAYFPDFWQLGMEYFGGKLAAKPDGQDLGRKQKEMRDWTTSTTRLFVALVSASVLPRARTQTGSAEFIWTGGGGESLHDWLPQCIGDVRDVLTELITLDLPKEMVDVVRELLFEIRSHSLSTMLHQLSLQIADLYKQETWTMEPEEGGFITGIPSLYETHVTTQSKLIRELLLQKYSDERQLLKSEEVRADLATNMGTALASFSDALEMLISDHPQQATPHSLPSKQEKLPPHSTRLLLILNNCLHTRETSLQNILTTLTRLGYPGMASATSKAAEGIRSVERLTFTKYTEVKYDPLVGQLEQSMYSGGYDWAKCTEPKSVRPYITKTLLGMVDVVAEVSSISSKLVTPVLQHVVEYVCDELTRLYSCIPSFSENGALQATLDVTAFRECVQELLTDGAKSLLKETLSLIPRSGEIGKSKKILQLLAEYRSRTKLQFQCFRMRSAVV